MFNELVPHKHKNTHKKHQEHPYRPRGVDKHAFKKVYWPYLPVMLVLTSAIVISTFGGQASRRLSFGRVLAYSNSMSVGNLLEQTNQQRLANGAASLSLNSKLSAAAQAKAADMASRDYWSHNTPDGQSPWVFIEAQGYKYLKVGENLATGYADEAATITAWMNSPAHRENLLDTDYTEVGFGYANIADYTAIGGGPMTIIVAHYGKPQVAAATTTQCPSGQTGTYPNCTATVASVKQSTTTASPPPATPTAADSNTATLTNNEPTITVEKYTPVTSASTNLDPPSKSTSQLQLLIRNPLIASIVGVGLVAAIFGAGMFLTGRHFMRLRRTIMHGEEFVMHHPQLDMIVLGIMAVMFLFTQTAGFIK